MKFSGLDIYSPYAVLMLAITVLPDSAVGGMISDDPGLPGRVAVPAALNKDAMVMSEGVSEALRLYWTPERLRDATPVPLPHQDPGTSDTTRSSKKGPSLRVYPTSPEDTTPSKGYASTTVSLNTQGLRWDGVKTLAARINGKLWFSDTDNHRYVCSASTVASAGKSLIVTASHCVRNKKGFYTHFLYIPGYNQVSATAAPYGEWAANKIYSANNEGHSSGNDVAFIELKPDKNNRKIEEVTGASGLYFNISASLAEKPGFRFGYPGNHEGGQALIYCYTHGEYEKDFLKHYCNMTGGSSGGPVVTDFPHNAFSYGHTFGVTSVSYGGTPARTGMALFGDVEKKVYQTAGRLLPEIYVEDGYVKMKNTYLDRDSAWFVYNPLSGHYPVGHSANVKISQILEPGDNKPYLKEGDVIYLYAQSTSTNADFTEGDVVRSKMVEVNIR